MTTGAVRQISVARPTSSPPRSSQVRPHLAVTVEAPAQVAEPSRAYFIAKRALDVTLSLTALIVLSPLMAYIALRIRAESDGNVLYGHPRIGEGGKPFSCWKFRTMFEGAHEMMLGDPELRHLYVQNDYKVPLEKDPRVTRFGRFLRKSSLDELPQLFNVLGGSMSLVGPRPIVREELSWYGDRVDEFLSARPGITGHWQVQGRSRIGYPERTDVELEAVASRSFWSEVLVLLKSIPAIITARGSL